MEKNYNPVALIILDGWGLRAKAEGNAIALANTPNFDRWHRDFERSVLDASGEAVGLPAGQMGNSEVGHLNLGAGRIVYQDFTRINLAIRNEELAKQAALAEAMGYLQAENGRKLHLIGLVSDGGVHSHINHLLALLRIAEANGVEPIIHLITDGRDTPPESGLRFAQQLEDYLADHPGVIASVSGRYYTMDRDKRWARTEKGYRVIAEHEGEGGKTAVSATAALQASYEAGITDEFVLPVALKTKQDVTISDGDCLLFYNFRADRMRQIVTTFLDDTFDGFARRFINQLHILTMTPYSDAFAVPVIFPEQTHANVLAEVLSKAGKTQFHTAETEKYPHVTYFFNGGEETPYEGEERDIVPSPKVATYDLKPEMSAHELTEMLLTRIETRQDDFILINYANPDMVGHTGVLEAAVQAVETVDLCANKVVAAIQAKGGVALITADHGNCDRMVDHETGEPHTYHTTQPVTLVAVGDGYFNLRPRGILADVAPTVLALLGVEQPKEMTGQSLLM